MLAAICGVDCQNKHDDHQLIPRIVEINDVGVGQRDDLLTDCSAQLAVAEDLIIPAEQVAFHAPAFAVDAVAWMQKREFLADDRDLIAVQLDFKGRQEVK